MRNRPKVDYQSVNYAFKDVWDCLITYKNAYKFIPRDSLPLDLRKYHDSCALGNYEELDEFLNGNIRFDQLSKNHISPLNERIWVLKKGIERGLI